MRLNSFADDEFYIPRAQRVSFDMHAKIRHGVARKPIHLRNLTPGGGNAEEFSHLRAGDKVTLYLPSLKPKDAVVVWTVDGIMGLEFERPLHPDIYESLVLHHAQWRPRTEADNQWHVIGKDSRSPVDALRSAA